MTGRGFGICGGGRGTGRLGGAMGFGGRGRGLGRRIYGGLGYGRTLAAEQENYPATHDETIAALEQEIKSVQTKLDELTGRLESMMESKA